MERDELNDLIIILLANSTEEREAGDDAWDKILAEFDRLREAGDDLAAALEGFTEKEAPATEAECTDAFWRTVAVTRNLQDEAEAALAKWCSPMRDGGT